MTLNEIAEMMKSGVEKAGFSDQLKFDCGEAGSLVIGNGQITLGDLPADCTLKLSLENLESLIKGKLNPMTAVMMGKIKISGNPAIAMKLKDLL